MLVDIKLPVVVPIFLFATLVVAVGFHIESVHLWVLLDLDIVGSDHVFGDVVVECGFVTVGKIWVFYFIRKNIVSRK